MAVEELFIFLLCGMIHIPFSHSRIQEYILINLKMNWTDAQQYCRERYTDLATIESAEDMSRIPKGAWIGLYDDPASWKGAMADDSNSWRWSATGTTSPGGYQNWALDEPDNAGGREQCTVMVSGVWLDHHCGHAEFVACYEAQSGLKQYTVVNSSMTWASAQSYCRQHYHDLAMIENGEENEALTSKVTPGNATWIGLYREPWRWSDNSPSLFRNWRYGEPNNKAIENCVVLVPLMSDYPCQFLHPFVCHGEKTSVTVVKIQLQSTVDLTDPAILHQLLRLMQEQLDAEGMDLKLKWNKPPATK